MNQIKIFVIHYSKLVERKKHILEQLQKYNITDFEFIETNNPDNLNIEYIKKMHDNIQIGLKSLNCKHLSCYDLIANSDKYDNYKYYLILEDDVFLQDDFTSKLLDYLKQLPEDSDILFIGNGCNLHTQAKFIKPNCNIYTNYCSRCADSYLITKQCADKMIKYFNNLPYIINCGIDTWMNKVRMDLNLVFYWAEPTIVCQGSQNGTFRTSY
jgi:GR25 family glycosyltransferase involved in LPS biosynthesis